MMSFAALWLLGNPASAQVTGQATLSGTVTDTSGAVVVGAQVTTTNVATGVSNNTVTNSTGYFEVDHLNPGTYSISVSNPGFEKLLRAARITLEADARLNVPIQLRPGAETQTVTITADALLLNTESASTGQVLTTQEVEDLTVSGSSPTWLELIAPGVQSKISQISSTGDGGGLIWQGLTQNFGTFGVIGRNEFNMDGAPNESNGEGEGLNQAPDSVGEMKMDITGYDASIGHTLGVDVTQTTKSGTNDIHGAVRESYQDTRWQSLTGFQARNYEYQQSLPANNCVNGAATSATCYALENKLGNAGTNVNNGDAAIGGPIYIPHLVNGHDKMFFFFSTIINKFAGSGPSTATLPTPQEETGNFSDWPTSTPPAGFIVGTVGSGTSAGVQGTCPVGTPYYGQYQLYNPFSVTVINGAVRRAPFCGNQISAQYLGGTMAQFYNNQLNLSPPNQVNQGGTNYAYASLTPQTLHDYTTREDLKLSKKDDLYVRYTWQRYTKQTIGSLFGNISHEQEARWIQLASIGWDHDFSDRTNVAISFGGTNYKNTCCYYPNLDQYNPSTYGLPGYTTTYAQGVPRDYELPAVSINTYSAFGQTDNPINTTRDFAVSGNITHVAGRHTIRAGGEWRMQNNAQGPSGNASGTYNFDNSYTQESSVGDPNFPAPGSGSEFALSYAAFLMGVNTSQSVAHNTLYSFQSPYYAVYAGDTWRVTPKLTIIPGIRFELEDGLVEKHNQLVVGWNPTASLPLISGPANAAYAATLAAATPAAQAVLPTSLLIQGGPMYAGVNGNPRTGYQNSYRFLPRFGATYRVAQKMVIRGGFGLYFDTMNALGPDSDQDEFSANTSQSSSTNFGQTFAAPLSNPFPANASGANFNSPIGSSAGSYYYLGANPSNLWDHAITPAREYRGSIGVQYQIGAATMLDVSFNIARISNILISKNDAYTPSSFYINTMQPNSATNALLNQQVPNPFNINNFSSVQSGNPAAYTIMSHASQYTGSTITVGTLVRAYPQMGGFTEHENLGVTHFQQVLTTFSHRWNGWVSLSDSLDLNYQHDADYFANAFDALPSFESSVSNSVPARFTLSEVWALPFGRGQAWATHGLENAIFGGFRVSTTYEAQTGNLLTFSNLFYVGTPSASQIKLRHPVFHMNNLTTNNGAANYIQWLNPGTATATVSGGVCSYSGNGFVTNSSCQPNNYNVRVFPRVIDGVRGMGMNDMNGNVTRNFHLAERFNLETTFEVYNIFNHQVYGSPNTTPTSTNFGQITGGGGSRWITLQGRLRY